MEHAPRFSRTSRYTQIATLAEVDIKTVRRALEGESVKPASARRIERALETLKAAGIDVRAELARSEAR